MAETVGLRDPKKKDALPGGSSSSAVSEVETVDLEDNPVGSTELKAEANEGYFWTIIGSARRKIFGPSREEIRQERAKWEADRKLLIERKRKEKEEEEKGKRAEKLANRAVRKAEQKSIQAEKVKNSSEWEKEKERVREENRENRERNEATKQSAWFDIAAPSVLRQEAIDDSQYRPASEDEYSRATRSEGKHRYCVPKNSHVRLRFRQVREMTESEDLDVMDTMARLLYDGKGRSKEEKPQGPNVAISWDPGGRVVVSCNSVGPDQESGKDKFYNNLSGRLKMGMEQLAQDSRTDSEDKKRIEGMLSGDYSYFCGKSGKKAVASRMARLQSISASGELLLLDGKVTKGNSVVKGRPPNLHGEMLILSDFIELPGHGRIAPGSAASIEELNKLPTRPMAGNKNPCLFCYCGITVFNLYYAEPLGFRVTSTKPHFVPAMGWAKPDWLKGHILDAHLEMARSEAESQNLLIDGDDVYFHLIDPEEASEETADLKGAARKKMKPHEKEKAQEKKIPTSSVDRI